MVWKEKRIEVFQSLIKKEVANQKCFECNSENSMVTCGECGHHLCAPCDISIHSKLPLHNRKVNIGGYWKSVSPCEQVDSEGNLTNGGKTELSFFCWFSKHHTN